MLLSVLLAVAAAASAQTQPSYPHSSLETKILNYEGAYEAPKSEYKAPAQTDEPAEETYPKPASYSPPPAYYGGETGGYEETQPVVRESDTWWLLITAGVICCLCVMIAGGCLCYNNFVVVRQRFEDKGPRLEASPSPAAVLSSEQLAVL